MQRMHIKRQAERESRAMALKKAIQVSQLVENVPQAAPAEGGEAKRSEVKLKTAQPVPE